MTRGSPLVLRTDASVAIGTGHVMRCLALAQAWQDAGGSALFVMAETTPAVEARLRNEGCEIARLDVAVSSNTDAEQTMRFARDRGASWIAVDGYAFGAEYQESLKRHGLKLLFIDDNGHAARYAADLVLNQNAHASESLYTNREPVTKLLLGPRYAMLRREFSTWREWKRDIPQVARKVLVTMGGSDPDNVTERVIEAILWQSEMKATVVVGGSNPHLPRLRALASQTGSSIELVENASSIPELMAHADIAVAGSGTTTWEMCFMGLPAILIVLADNQIGVADELSRRGIAAYLGESAGVSQNSIASELRRLANSVGARQEMSVRGRVLVDGRGAERVVAALKVGLTLRPAEEADCKLLWEWANDPTVRAVAFLQDPIPWDHHVAWFRSKLQDKNCQMFVALDEAALPVGQIRFDRTMADEAVIDIAIGPGFRGLGYGCDLIELGAQHMFLAGLVRLHAYVKPKNVASALAFEKAGFVRSETVNMKGHLALHYLRTAK